MKLDKNGNLLVNEIFTEYLNPDIVQDETYSFEDTQEFDEASMFLSFLDFLYGSPTLATLQNVVFKFLKGANVEVKEVLIDNAMTPVLKIKSDGTLVVKGSVAENSI